MTHVKNPYELKRVRAQKLLKDIRGKRIVVLGDVMLDEFTWGRVRRIAPEAPVPVVEVERETHHLGGAANVAANVRDLGGAPVLIGVVGADRARNILFDELERLGLDDRGLVVEADRPTTLKTRVMAHSHQIVRIDRELRLPISEDTERRVIDRAFDHLRDASALIVSDYDKGTLTPAVLERILHEAHRLGVPVCLDPKLKNFQYYQPVTVITPNHHEAEAITRQPAETEAGLIAAGRAVQAMLGNPNVLVTRGEAGMSLFSPDGAVRHIPVAAREVFDVTGAGDTVVAAIALALAAEASVLEAAVLSNHAAGVVVGKLGTATATPEEILETF